MSLVARVTEEERHARSGFAQLSGTSQEKCHFRRLKNELNVDP